MTKGSILALCALVLIFISSVAATMPPERGNGYGATKVGATGAIIGTGVTTLPYGRTRIWGIHSPSGSPGIASLFLGSKDATGSFIDSMTVGIPPGAPFEFYHPQGWDSAAVTIITAGDTLVVGVNN